MEFAKVEESAVAEAVSMKEQCDTRELSALQLVTLGGGLGEASLI